MTPRPFEKPIVFTAHARGRVRQRGTDQPSVEIAIRIGQRESAQRGLTQFRLNVPFGRQWSGRHYEVQQIVAVVAEESNRLVVVTVYTFYFDQEQAGRENHI
jgi:hypothetical protein